MDRFGILDYLAFLTRGPSVLLMADVSVVRTTPPKEDKVGTSSVEPPTAQALAAQSRSKVPNDTLADDAPELLNFDAEEFEIVCQMSSRLQSCWPDSGNRSVRFGIPDGPIFMPHDSGLPSLYLAMRMSKVAFGQRCDLPPSFLCHLPYFGLSRLIILGGHSSPMMTSFPLVVSARDGRNMFIFVENGSLSSLI
jgi:hypothetical protein